MQPGGGGAADAARLVGTLLADELVPVVEMVRAQYFEKDGEESDAVCDSRARRPPADSEPDTAKRRRDSSAQAA